MGARPSPRALTFWGRSRAKLHVPPLHGSPPQERRSFLSSGPARGATRCSSPAQACASRPWTTPSPASPRGGHDAQDLIGSGGLAAGNFRAVYRLPRQPTGGGAYLLPPQPTGRAGRAPTGDRYGVTVTTVNIPALKWPGMLQTKRYVPGTRSTVRVCEPAGSMLSPSLTRVMPGPSSTMSPAASFG